MKEEYSFEWDPHKDLTNRKKHHVSFEDAVAVWDDAFFQELPFRSLPGEEERYLVVGKGGKSEYLSVIITYRNGVIRIISARRSVGWERDYYEDHKQ